MRTRTTARVSTTYGHTPLTAHQGQINSIVDMARELHDLYVEVYHTTMTEAEARELRNELGCIEGGAQVLEQLLSHKILETV